MTDSRSTLDDEYDDWDDERDYGPDYDDWDDYREPEPSEEQIWRYEHEKYLLGLSPLRRFLHPAREFYWRRTWRWRMKLHGRWLLLTGQADEPPF